MWDWYSSGLWDADHREIGVAPEALGLSEELKEALSEWVEQGTALAESSFVAGRRIRRRRKTARRFENDKRRLWEALRAEAPAGVKVGVWHRGEAHWAKGEGVPELE